MCLFTSYTSKQTATRGIKEEISKGKRRRNEERNASTFQNELFINVFQAISMVKMW